MRLKRTLSSRLLLLLAVPVLALAQGGPRTPGSFWEGPWWNNRLVQNLNLSDAQKNDINTVLKDYRGKMTDVRTAMEKADADVQAAFNENPVDQRKANDAIEKLANSRADLTRTLSQLSLKLRTVLTADQWQELQRRQHERFERGRGPGGPGGPGGDGPAGQRPNLRPRFGQPPQNDTKQ